MPVNAIQSLIRTCSASTPQETSSSIQECPPPIASLGFWARKDVPLSAGTDSLVMKLRAERAAKTPPQPAPAPAPLLESLPFGEELEVRDRLSTAKAIADVGNDIRWDLIIEEAAKIPCGLRAGPTTILPKKACHSDDDDHRSTSASGSGGEEATGGESDETELEPDAPVSCGKLPPWRRSEKFAQRDQGRRVATEATTPPPWRRGETTEKSRAEPVERDVSTRVYAIATLLQCWSLMQHSPSEKESPVTAQPGPSATSATSDANGNKGAKSRTIVPGSPDAPWRRKRAATAATATPPVECSDPAN